MQRNYCAVIEVFDGIITSKMKVRLLVRLFQDAEQSSYLRQLSEELDVSTSQVKTELSNLVRADLLTSERHGRQIWYRANPDHPLYPELKSMNYILLALASAFLVAVSGCDSSSNAPDINTIPLPDPIDPSNFSQAVTTFNPFFPLKEGATSRFIGQTAGGTEEILVEVTDRKKLVQGVSRIRSWRQCHPWLSTS